MFITDLISDGLGQKNPSNVALFEICDVKDATNSRNPTKKWYYTFTELEAVTNSLSAAWYHRSKRDKKVIAVVIIGSSNDRVIAYVSCLKAHMVYCPVEEENPYFSRILSGAVIKFDVIIFDGRVMGDQFQRMLAQCPESVTQIDIASYLGSPMSGDVSLVPSAEASHHATMDWAHIIFTSGTSGSGPKALVCNHWGSINSHRYRNKCLPYAVDDIVGCCIFGIWDAVAALMAGVSCCILPDSALQDPVVLMRAVLAGRVSRMMMTPSLLSSCLASAEAVKLWQLPYNRLNLITLCGEVAKADLLQRSNDIMPQVRIANLYSLSECHDVAYLPLPLSMPTCIPGRIFPNVSIRIERVSSSSSVSYGNDEGWGTLCIGGASVALGFAAVSLDGTENILTSIGNGFFEEDGERWFRTADIGRILDSNASGGGSGAGVLELRGRDDDSDVVKIRGRLVSLAEIESFVSLRMNTEVGCWRTSLQMQAAACAVVQVQMSLLVSHEDSAQAAATTDYTGIISPEEESKSVLCACLLLNSTMSPATAIAGDLEGGNDVMRDDSLWGKLRGMLVAADADNIMPVTIPTHGLFVRNLPLKIGSGKLDRKKLTAMVQQYFDNGSYSTAPVVLSESCNARDVVHQIVEIFDRVLLVKPIKPSSHFFSHGGDSVAAIHLLGLLQKQLGLRLGVKDLLLNPSPAAIAALVASSTPADFELMDASSTPAYLRIELAKHLTTLNSHPTFTHKLKSTSPTQPRVHIIAGCTGFIGRHLLHQLLLSDATIIVKALVRADTKINYADLSRVVYIKVDLNAPYLGLESDQYSDLISGVHSVYNCTGMCDCIAPYQAFIAANVLTTLRLICLAIDADAVLYHMSTSAIFPPRGTPASAYHSSWCDRLTHDSSAFLSDNSLHQSNLYGGLWQGYMQSKWLAEQLIWNTQMTKDLRCVVLRPSNVGVSIDKPGSNNDMLTRILGLCERTRSYPLPVFEASTPSNHSCGFGWVHVTTLARFVTHLSLRDDDRKEHIGKAYHLTTHLQPLESFKERLGFVGLPTSVWIQHVLYHADVSLESFLCVDFACDSLLGHCELPMIASEHFIRFCSDNQVRDDNLFQQNYETR